jgi:hypothetical protein
VVASYLLLGCGVVPVLTWLWQILREGFGCLEYVLLRDGGTTCSRAWARAMHHKSKLWNEGARVLIFAERSGQIVLRLSWVVGQPPALA